MTKQTLIIGFEDTDEGRDALALGGQISRALGATPIVVGAVPAPIEIAAAKDIAGALAAVAAERLEGAVKELTDLGAEGRGAVSTSAARALYEDAESSAAVAAVVGSSSRGVIGRLVPGSTAERLLHGAPCAVAVAARGYAAEKTRLLRVAVAFDGSPEAALALDAAIAIARPSNSTLTLLTVIASTTHFYAPGATLPIAEFESSQERLAQEQLDKGIARVPSDLPAQGLLLRGAPGQALVEVSDDFDLMVVGSRAYGPLRRTLTGSTSSRLFHASRCSVLATPRGSGPLGAVGGELAPDDTSVPVRP